MAVEVSVLVDEEADERAECEDGVRRRTGAETCWTAGVFDRLVGVLVGVARVEAGSRFCLLAGLWPGESGIGGAWDVDGLEGPGVAARRESDGLTLFVCFTEERVECEGVDFVLLPASRAVVVVEDLDVVTTEACVRKTGADKGSCVRPDDLVFIRLFKALTPGRAFFTSNGDLRTKLPIISSHSHSPTSASSASGSSLDAVDWDGCVDGAALQSLCSASLTASISWFLMRPVSRASAGDDSVTSRSKYRRAHVQKDASKAPRE